MIMSAVATRMSSVPVATGRRVSRRTSISGLAAVRCRTTNAT
jgi:hypothetical protein